MDVETEFEIFEYEEGLSIELPIKPYGFGLFMTRSVNANGRLMLRKLRIHWETVWPQLKNDLEFMLADHQTGLTLAKDDFEATLTDFSDGFESRILISFDFGIDPFFDFLLKDGKLDRGQPSF